MEMENLHWLCIFCTLIILNFIILRIYFAWQCNAYVNFSENFYEILLRPASARDFAYWEKSTCMAYR